ncbi:MAG: hypothetical protein ACK5P4_12080 [Bacteroidota bacterium]
MKSDLKYFTSLGFICISLLICSCAGTIRSSKSITSSSFLPTFVEMRVTMDDYEYLGTIEVDASYKKYFGIFKIYSSINGQDVPVREVNILNIHPIGTSSNSSLSNPNINLKRALYRALTKNKDTDFIIPISITKEKQRMFLGSYNLEKYKVKLYKIKEK